MSGLWQRNATKLGEALAEEHFSSLPIQPIQLAEKLGIQVEPLPPDRRTVSGILVYAENEFGIQYATYIGSPGFQNFCVAHELGHYSIPGHPEKLLSNGYHESRAGFSSGDRCEQEADHFAAGLLMPSFLFDPAMDTMQSGIMAIESLCALCETSMTATAIRYAQQTYDPVAVVVSEGHKVCYCFLSDEMKEIKGLSWIKKDTPLPRDTVTYRFNLHENNVLNGNKAEGEASFSHWFSCNHSYELYEEVVGLGRYGKTLTVLTASDLPDQNEPDEEEELLESWTPRFRR